MRGVPFAVSSDRHGAALGSALAAWLAFAALFGIPGFNLREDGYLLTVAARIRAGEVPYRDFAYIRPPLPLVVPLALLAWVPDHVVLVARLYVTLQGAGMLVVVYALLVAAGVARSRAALLALVGAVLACTGGFPPAPWHTMDGVCYSAITVAALAAAMARRRPLLAFGAGAAAAGAALSKQGFVAVAMAGVAGTLTAEGRRVGRRPWSALLAYVGGAAAVCLPLVFVLGSTGALAAALQAVVTDPREVTREVLGYGNWELLVGMHLPSGTGLTVGLSLVLLCLGALRSRLALGLGLAMTAWLLAVFWTSRSVGRVLREFVLEPSYVLAWLGGIGLLAAHALGRCRLPPWAACSLALALCTLYASVWSYVGVRSATFAFPVVVPLVVGLAGIAGTRPREADPAPVLDPTGRGGRGPVLALAALALVSVAGQLPTRVRYTAAFRTPGLLGVSSTPARVRSVDDVVALVRGETRSGEPVFVLSDLPGFYFLAGRPNPTRVDWLLPQELSRAEIRRAVNDLERRPPRLVIVTDHDIFQHGPSRLRPILAYLGRRYVLAHRDGELDVYRPRDAAAGS